MGAIVWLASYPKSGNTWVRAFLTNYLRDGRSPADINALEGAVIAGHRPTFDELVGVPASDLTELEIARYRPGVYRRLTSQTSAPLLVKVHDAYRRSVGSASVFPEDIRARGIYIVRNPLDVAVSAAHYFRISFPESVRRMADGWTLASPGGHLKEQLAQVLLSWSDHVESWLDGPACQVHLVRFEDLIGNPRETFEGVVAAAGLEHDSDRLARAIRFSAFEELQSQEQATGFGERIPIAPVFFRRGRVGAWREELDDSLADSIIATHHAMMQRLGYLTERNEPRY